MTITATSTRITGLPAVNVFDHFWLLKDADGIDIHTVDPSNGVDDITLGERLDSRATAAEAAEYVAHFIVLDETVRNAIVAALA